MAAYTDEQWNEAKRLYVEDGESYRSIEASLGINFHTLARRGSPKRDNWDRLRKQYFIDKAESEHHELTKRLLYNGKLKAESRAHFVRASDKLREAIEAELQSFLDRNAPIPADVLSKLASALSKAQQINFAAMGVTLATIELEHKHNEGPKTFQDWIGQLRQERGVPERKYPFAESKN